jgi:hypothetical protein
MERDDGVPPINAKVVLIDPDSSTVLWMNESARQEYVGPESPVGLPLAQAFPLADSLGVGEAVAQVAATGEARHLRTGLVSTSRGTLTIGSSMYRLPDGNVLLVTENAWQAERRKPGDDGVGRGGRRGR